MDGLTFRKATAADTERIVEILSAEPEEEEIAIAGGLDRARATLDARVRLPSSFMGWERTVLAELDGEAVGVLQAGGNPDAFAATKSQAVRMALHLLRIFGPIELVRFLRRLRARERVQLGVPNAAYHIAEVNVHPGYRNRGIGGAMLRYAEDEARKGGHPLMSLHTTTANPARRLYERHGFRVVETRTDPEYERFSGMKGRLLMVKELG